VKLHDLEHIIRACADITGQYEFIIIGSQAILGSQPWPEDVLTLSMEADIYPLQAPELADMIEGNIGEGSSFHDSFGYYAQGVGPETAYLPTGWLQRVRRIQSENTRGYVGYCLSALDLFLAKAAAARDKDRIYCTALLSYGYVQIDAALELVSTMPLDALAQQKLRQRIRRWAKSAQP